MKTSGTRRQLIVHKVDFSLIPLEVAYQRSKLGLDAWVNRLELNNKPIALVLELFVQEPPALIFLPRFDLHGRSMISSRANALSGITHMARMVLRYVEEFIDRHGKVRRYFRRGGKRVCRLPGLPGSAEFMAAYQTAVDGITVPKIETAAPRTVRGCIISKLQGTGT